NQVFSQIAGAARQAQSAFLPGRPGNIYPRGKVSLTIRNLAWPRAIGALRASRGAKGRAMAKQKPAEAEADEGAEGEGAAAPKKGFLSRKLIIMVAAGLLVAGGGGGGGYF